MELLIGLILGYIIGYLVNLPADPDSTAVHKLPPR